MLETLNIAFNAFLPIRLVRPSNLKWETNIEGTFVLCNIKCLKRRVEKIHTLSKYVPNPNARQARWAVSF